MPKIGAEPIRRAALIKATIEVIGEIGSLDVTVAQISRRAGVSSALAHHYFGSKEQLFLAAMRAILSHYKVEMHAAVGDCRDPSGRLRGIIAGSFSAESFGRESTSAWLNFYVLAQTLPQAKRLLRVYQRRLHSNLVFALRPLVGARADTVAVGMGALIDGVYIRAALADGAQNAQRAIEVVTDYLDREIATSGV